LNNKEKYCYWEEYAQYDLDTAIAMFDSGRYLYSAFMCQQAIEKIVKGLYVLYTNEEPVKSHNIALIFNNLCNTDTFKENVLNETFHFYNEKYTSLFVKLLAFYISARYPVYKEKLSTVLSRNEADELLMTTKEAFIWLKSLRTYLK